MAAPFGVMIRLLSPITILGDAQEREIDILHDWSRGLDWVHWLFTSIRARHEHLLFSPKATQRALLTVEWNAFAENTFLRMAGPALVEAWMAASAGDLPSLIKLDQSLSTAPWSQGMQQANLAAGTSFLRRTKGARYQGILGKFRSQVDEGETPGHFLTAWAAAGPFFQLGLANVVAEYLRLEWEMAQRSLDTRQDPAGKHSIAALTSRMLHHQAQWGPQLLAEA